MSNSGHNAGKISYFIGKKLDSYLLRITKINSRWIEDIHVKGKMLTLLVEIKTWNRKKKFKRHKKAWAKETYFDESVFIKTKNFHRIKDIRIKVKRHSRQWWVLGKHTTKTWLGLEYIKQLEKSGWRMQTRMSQKNPERPRNMWNWFSVSTESEKRRLNDIWILCHTH